MAPPRSLQTTHTTPRNYSKWPFQFAMVCPLVFKFAFGVLNKCAATVNIKARSVNLNEFNNCRMVTHLHPYVPDCDRIRIQVSCMCACARQLCTSQCVNARECLDSSVSLVKKQQQMGQNGQRKTCSKYLQIRIVNSGTSKWICQMQSDSHHPFQNLSSRTAKQQRLTNVWLRADMAI